MWDLSGTLCRLRFGDSARRCPWVLAGLLIGLAVVGHGQEAETGITIPATVTGGLMKSDDAYFGYHGAVYPALRLNEHWYAYGAVDIYSTPFFYYPEYNGREWSDVHLNQAYVARTWKGERAGWVVKAGKVPTAFGSPGREYDDMQNPLLDQPLSFTSPLPLYPTLNVCPGAQALCFNYSPSYYSFAPMTLYGLWGGEVAGWWKHLDGRAQAANSSPMNPQPLTSGDQHAQWSAGGGYTIGPGFRVGVSGFRGRWLNGIDGAAGTGISTWQPPATGVGVDAEWARGRWKMKAEWQRLTFNYPAAFQTAIPTATFAWTETKVILTPRLYVAARVGYQHVNNFATASVFAPNVARYEGAIGFRPDRFQLMKVGYEWNQLGQTSADMDNVFGVQLVTALPAFSRALR